MGTYTYYPDANPETSSVDGYCTEVTDAVWDTIRTAAGDDHGDFDNYIYVGYGTTYTVNQYGDLYRGHILFNTADIPDGETITSATLGIRGFSKVGTLTGDFTVNIYESTCNSNTALVDSDYAEVGDTPFSDGVTYADWDTTGYNVFTLNEAGLAFINKTGVTKFSVRIENDATGTEPLWDSYKLDWVVGWTAEYGEDYRPYLTVVTGVSVTTEAATATDYDSSILHGTTSDTFTSLGFHYGTVSGTLPYMKGASGTTGDFNATISKLNAGTTYYFKASGIYEGEFYYGDELNFTTTNPADYDRTSDLTVIVQDGKSRPIFLAECIAWTYGDGFIERQWSDNGYATFNYIPNNIPVYVTAQWGSNYIRWDNVYASSGANALTMTTNTHVQNTDDYVKGTPTEEPSSPTTGMVYSG